MRKYRFLLPLAVILAVSAIAFFYVRPVRGGSQEEELAETIAYLTEEREAALQTIESGDPWQGAAIVAISVRSILNSKFEYPTDALVDETTASLRVGIFAIMYLLDADQRKQFVETVLEPDKYETDEMLILSHDISNGPDLGETIALIERLTALSGSPYPVIRLGALMVMADPYLFELWPLRAKARVQLATEFPDLAVTQCVLRWSLEWAAKKSPAIAQNMLRVVDAELSSDAEKNILAADPVLASVAPTLPGAAKGSGSDTVAVLCQGIAQETDWRVRYGYVNLAERSRVLDLNHAIDDAVETLANSDAGTPDVIHAKCYALGYAVEEKDLERVIFWGEDLLSVGRIYDCFDRPLHEAVWQGIDRYAEFLAETGRPADAALVYQRMAAKYPNSRLAQQELEKIGALRK